MQFHALIIYSNKLIHLAYSITRLHVAVCFLKVGNVDSRVDRCVFLTEFFKKCKTICDNKVLVSPQRFLLKL